MSIGSLITMVLMLTLVWGSLIVLLVIAFRKEREKSRDEVK